MFLKHQSDILILAEGTSHHPAGGLSILTPIHRSQIRPAGREVVCFNPLFLPYSRVDRQGTVLTLKDDCRLEFWRCQQDVA